MKPVLFKENIPANYRTLISETAGETENKLQSPPFFSHQSLACSIKKVKKQTNYTKRRPPKTVPTEKLAKFSWIFLNSKGFSFKYLFDEVVRYIHMRYQK